MHYLKCESSAPESVDGRILKAALGLFVKSGYHNVSVHDIQRAADVSIGSIYNHFGGKEGIAKALYFHLLNEMQGMVDGVLVETESARERCNRIIELLFEYTETRRDIIAFVLHQRHQEFLPGEPPICSAAPFRAMREVIQQGMDNGEIRRRDPWVAASAVFGSAIRMIHLRLDEVVNEPLPRYLDEILAGTWQGMEPDAASSPKKRKPMDLPGQSGVVVSDR
ncbi:MAG: TetR/AcrR family transcriptional regulator [Gammaproteobacteria bacterium]|nr:TetR/AcrR family transcriptional regulator [Gammaproteobacteria bacterium]